MADVQDGARGPPGTKEWVKLQLQKVARALGKDIDHAQIHECAMSHICVDPGIERGRRAELIRMEKTGQALRKRR